MNNTPIAISLDVKNQLIEDCIRHGRSTTLIEQKYSIAKFLHAEQKLLDEFPDYKPPLKDMPLEFRCQVVNHYPSAENSFQFTFPENTLSDINNGVIESEDQCSLRIPITTSKEFTQEKLEALDKVFIGDLKLVRVVSNDDDPK